ncbi:MAG: hypothetical protein HOO91_17050 [Bacteroidales bacterium]|nr:hypothetical protein [Bacteroidales bacterium]
MKKAVYILGVIAGVFFLIGLFLKGQHCCINYYIKMIAALAGIIFIPLFALYIYKKDKD